MRKSRILLGVALLSLGVLGGGQAQTITNTYTVSKNVQIAPNGTYRDVSSTMSIGPVVSGGDDRVFFAFDLSALDLSRVITKATLRIYASGGGTSGSARLYPVLATWDPATIAYGHETGALITSFLSGSWAVGWHELNVLETAQSWRTNPSSHHGLALRAVEGFSGTRRDFHSKDGDNPPELVIEQSGVPEAPTGVIASGADGEVAIVWDAMDRAETYNVKRSQDGVNYTTVASGLTQTAYTNTGLLNGYTYYYRISALNDDGESFDSAVAVAVPVQEGYVVRIIPVLADLYTRLSGEDTLRTENAELHVGNVGSGHPNFRSFYAFNLPQLGSGEILSARMRLYVRQAGGSGTTFLHPVADPWTASDVAYNQAVGDEFATFSVNSTATGWVTWDVRTLAQSWQANPAAYHGFRMQQTEGAFSGTDRILDSSRGQNPPELVIQTRLVGTMIMIK